MIERIGQTQKSHLQQVRQVQQLEQEAQQHGTLTTSYTTGYGTDYEISVGGERVMMTSRGEWQTQMTVLEQKKQAEFQAMYSRAFEAAENELKNG